MATCSMCRSEISYFASKCPRCTADIRSAATKDWGVLKLGALILGAFLIWELLKWIFGLFVNMITWIWDVITWPFKVFWKITVWFGGVISDFISLLGFIINYPAVTFNKLIGYSFNPEWWQTAISLIVEIGAILLVLKYRKFKKSMLIKSL